MPTATPKIENTINGKVQKFSIEANDPELDEVFSDGAGEIGISGGVRSSSIFDGRDATPLSGGWTVQLRGGVGSGEDIGQLSISAQGRTMKFNGRMKDKLDSFIGEYFSQDERERKAGDWSFDSDHANEILGSNRIVFYREIEELEPEPSPGIPDEEEPDPYPTYPIIPGRPEDSQREMNPLLIYVIVAILAYVISR